MKSVRIVHCLGDLAGNRDIERRAIAFLGPRAAEAFIERREAVHLGGAPPDEPAGLEADGAIPGHDTAIARTTEAVFSGRQTVRALAHDSSD